MDVMPRKIVKRPTPMSARLWIQEDIDKARAMDARGHTAKEIGRALGRTPASIYSKLWELGIKRGKMTTGRINLRLEPDAAVLLRNYCKKHKRTITETINTFVRIGTKEEA
jgi:hypothetical protein